MATAKTQTRNTVKPGTQVVLNGIMCNVKRFTTYTVTHCRTGYDKWAEQCKANRNATVKVTAVSHHLTATAANPETDGSRQKFRRVTTTVTGADMADVLQWCGSLACIPSASRNDDKKTVTFDMFI